MPCILVLFAKIFLGITFLGTRLKSAAKPPDGYRSASAEIPWWIDVWKQGYGERMFFKTFVGKLNLLNFLYFKWERIISSNFAVCVHEPNVFALLFFLGNKIFNSDSCVASEMNPKGILAIWIASFKVSILSVTCFVEGLAGVKYNRKKCTSSWTVIENLHCRLTCKRTINIEVASHIVEQKIRHTFNSIVIHLQF